jgi:toxin CcdB
MPQFDLYRNPRGGRYPLLLDVQADLLEQLATRVVVPLTRAEEHAPPITTLNPTATIEEVEYVLEFQELAAVPRSALAAPIGSLASRRSEWIAAIDLLFTGI